MITINFFTTLRALVKTKQIRVTAEETSILNLLKYCETQTSSPFVHTLLDEEGHIHAEAIILVNGHNVLQLDGIQTIVRDGADIALFPPGEKV